MSIDDRRDAELEIAFCNWQSKATPGKKLLLAIELEIMKNKSGTDLDKLGPFTQCVGENSFSNKPNFKCY